MAEKNELKQLVSSENRLVAELDAVRVRIAKLRFSIDKEEKEDEEEKKDEEKPDKQKKCVVCQKNLTGVTKNPAFTECCKSPTHVKCKNGKCTICK